MHDFLNLFHTFSHQFYRNFPGPTDVEEEDMKLLIEKYNDPQNPGLVNYLNLHHDVLAVHKHVLKEKEPANWNAESNVDMVPLFVSLKFYVCMKSRNLILEKQKSLNR